MLDHVSIAVADIARAVRFYDAVLGALGVARVGSDARWAGYGERADPGHPGRTYLSLREADPGAPLGARHWAFKAASHPDVDAFWQAGLAHGGRDDGPPGLRPHYHAGYYAAFLVDPDGNRIEAVCHGAGPTA